jgi:hypothetical protein
VIRIQEANERIGHAGIHLASTFRKVEGRWRLGSEASSAAKGGTETTSARHGQARREEVTQDQLLKRRRALAQPSPASGRGQLAGTGTLNWRSRPISRVLSRTTIHLGYASPRTSSDLPGSLHGPCVQHRVRDSKTACFPIWSCSRRGLPCHRVLPPARCALTAPFHPYRLREEVWRFVFCCTFRGLTSPRRYLAPCPGSPDFPPRLRAAVVWPTPARMVGARCSLSKQ